MNRLWGSLLGVLLGFLLAGVLLLTTRPPQGVAITLRPAPTPAPLVVDVEGAVAAPGVYLLPSASRVQDALDAAGGLLPEAASQNLNLAAPLTDGQRLWVAAAPQGTEPAQNPSVSRAPQGGIDISQGGAALIDISTATQSELESLPGIGPSLASSIVAYREEHGPFASIEDIQNVSGIGPAKFEKIRSLITVSP
jgi:competence protein ComEA